MANPFAGLGDLFGPPAALRVEQLQQEGANQRAGMAVGEQRRQFDQTQALLQDAARTWAQITQRHTGAPIVGVTPGVQHEFSGMDMPQITMQPGSPNLAAALREFITTPQFISLGNAGVNFGNLINTLSQNPNALTEAFTLGPGQQRFGPNSPRNPQTGQLMPFAENTNAPPGQQGPLTQQQGQVLLQWVQQGQTAAEMEPMLTDLQTMLDRPDANDASVITGAINVFRGRLGLPPSSTTAQVIQAISTRFVPQLHGTGVMTDSDRSALEQALPNIGNSREANQIVFDILQRTVQRAVQRGQIAMGAFQSNTPEAVQEAFQLWGSGNQDAMDRHWLRRSFNLSAEQLSPNNRAQVLELGRLISEANGGVIPPRAERFLRNLMQSIQAGGR